MLPSCTCPARATPARHGNMLSLVWQTVLEGQNALQLEEGAGLGSLRCHHFAGLPAGPVRLQRGVTAWGVCRGLAGLQGRAGRARAVASRRLGAPEPAAALQQLAGAYWISRPPAGGTRAAPSRAAASAPVGFARAAACDAAC